MDEESQKRHGPVSLYGLTPEEALRRAMSVPAPAHDPKPPKPPEKAKKKKPGGKKKG